MSVDTGSRGESAPVWGQVRVRAGLESRALGKRASGRADRSWSSWTVPSSGKWSDLSKYLRVARFTRSLRCKLAYMAAASLNRSNKYARSVFRTQEIRRTVPCLPSFTTYCLRGALDHPALPVNPRFPCCPVPPCRAVGHPWNH